MRRARGIVQTKWKRFGKRDSSTKKRRRTVVVREIEVVDEDGI